MDCTEIRDALLAGSVPTGPGVEAHVRDCAACGELLSNEGALGRALSRSEMPPVSGEELFASVERAVLAESGPRAWLRSRPTPVRALVAVLAGAAVVAIGGRSAVGGAAPGTNAPWLAAFGLAATACLWMLVAPLGRPRPPMALRFALVASALLLPFGYAALASAPPSPSTGAVELGFAEQAVACFSYGSFLALPFLAVVWAVERSDRPFLLLLVGLGAVAGVVANAALALHCPNTESAHLALGHATVGVALALAGALWSLSTRRPSWGPEMGGSPG
jgi:hypothetical protein